MKNTVSENRLNFIRMKKIEIVQKINAPVKEVWDYISDIKSAPDWVVVMNSLVSTTDNPVKLNTVYKEKSQVGPKESETTWKVTKFEQEKIQVHECYEKDFKAVLTMQVEPMDSGTKLIHITEYALMPVFRPLGWLAESIIMHKTITKNLQESVNNCKQIIEKNNK